MSKSDEIKALWDKAVSDYDKHMEDTGHYQAQERLYKLLKDNFESPVLDLACGSGFLSSLLLKDGYEVVLNDFSLNMIEFAKRYIGDNMDATFSNQDATNFRFSRQFNTILCCNLFYYLQNRDIAIEHWSKYLFSDGAIILFEEYPFQRPETKEMSEHEEKLMSLIDPVSPEQIIEIFKKHDFILITETSVPIDSKHNLFGFVFRKA